MGEKEKLCDAGRQAQPAQDVTGKKSKKKVERREDGVAIPNFSKYTRSRRNKGSKKRNLEKIFSSEKERARRQDEPQQRSSLELLVLGEGGQKDV